MDTFSVKKDLREYYNHEAVYRDRSEKQEWKIQLREDFCRKIKQENMMTLLELGAGTGNDSQFFMDNGLIVTAVDLSSEMVNKCKEKGIEAYELDFYNLSSLNNTFDCIWAMNSLLHVPKDDLDQVLNAINFVLNENGLFYMGVYGGVDSETHFVNEVLDTPRFFSYYTKDRLESVLANHFQIIHFEQFDVGRNTDFQSILMRKK